MNYPHTRITLSYLLGTVQMITQVSIFQATKNILILIPWLIIVTIISTTLLALLHKES